MSESENELNCPVDCPNRKKDGNLQRGKWGAYAFAFVVSAFLGFQCVSAERKGVDVPMLVWMPALVLIGGALGVQIDAASLGKFLGK
ncbi:hypothetical protein [Pantanalinema sp. GBBB05]|uniref:hypothetical protein n=1 Tax=Pantanalinema sp. GBBB05 TaxID=2604139 RepID=UPI001E14DDAF|nr:hypothetical protein [Pantanalinema sp. GBBB05]